MLKTTVTIPFHQKRTLRLRGVSELAQGHAHPEVAPTVSDPSLGHLYSVRTSEPKYMGSDSGPTIYVTMVHVSLNQAVPQCHHLQNGD